MTITVRQNFFCNVYILVVVIFFGISEANERNVCPTFEDYKTVKNNTNCWYDFTAEKEVDDVARLLGYDFERYKVQTKDGYILSLFKISSRNRVDPAKKYYPVYFQHGLLSLSSYFVAVGRDSLAFLLADEGHDVWLGNYRGNRYSEEHINYTVKDKAFWDYTMDEIVEYDLPAMFGKIMEESPIGGQIIYIGHSLGTSLALMYSAEFPIEAKKMFKFIIFLAPAYTLTNVISPARWIAVFGGLILGAVEDLGLMRLLSQSETTNLFLRTICLENPRFMQACQIMWNFAFGLRTIMKPEMVPVFFHQMPGGGSLKLINHVGDLTFGNFRHYDYGFDGNIRRYGKIKPPEYDIEKIETPIYMVYSAGDWLTTEKDALNLYKKLPKKAKYGIRKIAQKNFNHIDFLYTKEARRIVYDDLLEVINNFLLT